MHSSRSGTAPRRRRRKPKDFALALGNETVLDRWGGVPMPPEQWRAFLGWSAFRPDLSFPLRDADSGAAVGMLLTYSWDADTAATGGFDRASVEVDADSPEGANGLYERAGFTVARTEVRCTLAP